MLIFFLLIIVLGGVLITSTFLPKVSKTETTYVEDVELFCEEHGISFSIIDEIQYYLIDDQDVLVWDQRNSDKSQYIHSDISASISPQGILTVTITNTDAISEGDISGSYAVLIKCEKKIEKVIIEQEQKTK